MLKLKLVFVLIIAIVTALWLTSLSTDAFGGDIWAMRRTLIYYSGILAMGMMSIAVILAARPVLFESALGGLDKFYRLHKWLGIGGVSLAIVHWMMELVPRWMVGQGWLVRPPRPAAPAAADLPFDPFRDLHGIARDLGEWGIYLLIALTVLALWKRFPYRYFFKTHRVMAALYLVLVFHSIVLMKPSFWSAPIGPAMAALMLAGSIGALLSLFHRIGYARRAVGAIDHLDHHTGNSVLDVGVRLQTSWPGHLPGQFAFVTFDKSEGAHPFTMSSVWKGDGKLVFSIKGLGDYTKALPDTLRVGDNVTVEGPYGRFQFDDEAKRQIWVAGGIGISPFLAGLRALKGGRHERPIDLVYCTRAPDERFIGTIRQLANDTGVRLHLLVQQSAGRLTAARLCEMVPQWAEAQVWFCGPQKFGAELRDGLSEIGLPPGRFHQELFEMR